MATSNNRAVQTLPATTDTQWSRHKSRPLQATALPAKAIWEQSQILKQLLPNQVAPIPTALNIDLPILQSQRGQSQHCGDPSPTPWPSQLAGKGSWQPWHWIHLWGPTCFPMVSSQGFLPDMKSHRLQLAQVACTTPTSSPAARKASISQLQDLKGNKGNISMSGPADVPNITCAFGPPNYEGGPGLHATPQAWYHKDSIRLRGHFPRWAWFPAWLLVQDSTKQETLQDQPVAKDMSSGCS